MRLSSLSNVRAVLCVGLLSSASCSPSGDDTFRPPPPGDAGGDAADTASASCPTDDGSTVIATVPAVAGLAAGDGFVYWVVAATGKPLPGLIFRAPIGGGASEQFTERLAVPKDLVVRDGILYWLELDGTDNKLVRMAATAGSSSKLIAPSSDAPKGFFVDAAGIYAAVTAGVSKYPLEGGAAELQDQVKVTSAKGVAVDTTNIVVASEDNGVQVYPKEKPIKPPPVPPPPTTLEDGSATLGNVVLLDETYAYWMLGKNLKRAPFDGTGKSDTLEAETSFVTISSGKVYWSTYLEGVGGLIRYPTADGTPKVLLNRKATIGQIAVDTSAVFWAEPTPGTDAYCIMRKPRA